MDTTILRIDASDHRLRRVGRLARRRMRVEGSRLRNGLHTDGNLSVEISGLAIGAEVAAVGGPKLVRWQSNRPVALVIVRSGVDGDDVTFLTGPVHAGVIDPSTLGSKEGISYIAFCYDLEPDARTATSSVGSAAVVGSILARLLRSGSPA